jgi:hypothetical protein
MSANIAGPQSKSSNRPATFTSIDVLASLHRGGGAITFHRQGSRWQDLGAIPVSELREQYPRLAPHVQRDSFFSLNSMRPQRNDRRSELTGLPIWSRRTTNVSAISTLWVDLDAHKIGMTASKVLVRFLRDSDLPDPRWMAFSGRGLWAIWEIVPVSSDHSDVQRRVLRALQQRFVHLGADIASAEPAHVMRVPGSLNSKSGTHVRFIVSDPVPPIFTLTEWANLLGVTSRPTRLPGESKRNGKPNATKQRAARQRWVNALDGFHQLRAMRGHFTEGVRHNAVWIYVFLLTRLHTRDEEVRRQAAELASSCDPPLAESELRKYVRLGQASARRPQPFRNDTIVDLLKITPEEQATLTGWFKPQPTPRKNRITQRRELIERELDHDPGLTIEALHDRLARIGLDVSPDTVWRDRKEYFRKRVLDSRYLEPKAQHPKSEISDRATKTAPEIRNRRKAPKTAPEIENPASESTRPCRHVLRRRVR